MNNQMAIRFGTPKPSEYGSLPALRPQPDSCFAPPGRTILTLSPSKAQPTMQSSVKRCRSRIPSCCRSLQLPPSGPATSGTACRASGDDPVSSWTSSAAAAVSASVAGASGSSCGYFDRRSGRAPFTGILSKLYDGGEGNVHSSVRPSHGSAGAFRLAHGGEDAVQRRSTATAIVKAPMVEPGSSRSSPSRPRRRYGAACRRPGCASGRRSS